MRLDKLCVFGSGNALNPHNHIFRARLEKALALETYEGDALDITPTTAVFGRQQPGMNLSEAESGRQYMRDRYFDQKEEMLVARAFGSMVDVYDGPEVKSIAGTCQVIVDAYLSHDEKDDAHYYHVWLITNWPYIWRTRYLLKKAAQREGLNWSKLKHRVHLAPCGGTFRPYFKKDGLKAIPWWLKRVAFRELGAWVKAILDPYDQHLNQQRTAPGA